jgi:hypothetical protein
VNEKEDTSFRCAPVENISSINLEEPAKVFTCIVESDIHADDEDELWRNLTLWDASHEPNAEPHIKNTTDPVDDRLKEDSEETARLML